MKTKNSSTPKAYKNVEFLNSPDARVIRILSEFLEPFRRFRRHNVKDTIVFFGSARVKSREEARRRLKELERRASTRGRQAARQQAALVKARAELAMSRYYEDAVEVARLLTRWSKSLKDGNRFVVCSGGGPGIMEAANRGATKAKGLSVGLNISIPFEQEANRFISPGLGFEFHYFFMRKFWFVYLAKALIMFPGGFGTLDELMEVLTLLQTSKIKKKVTVVLYGSEYWKSILNFDRMLELGVINRADTALFTFADTPQEAYRIVVRDLRKNYPSAAHAGRSRR